MQQLGFIDSRKRLAVRKPSPGEHMGSPQHIIVCIALKQLSLFLFERGDGGYLPIKRPIRGLLTRQCADCPIRIKRRTSCKAFSRGEGGTLPEKVGYLCIIC